MKMFANYAIIYFVYSSHVSLNEIQLNKRIDFHASNLLIVLPLGITNISISLLED